jgi:hypothetical protein
VCQICCSVTSNCTCITIKPAVHQHRNGCTSQNRPFINIELSLYEHQTGCSVASNTFCSSQSGRYQYQTRCSIVASWLFSSIELTTPYHHTQMCCHVHDFRCSPSAWIHILLPVYHNIRYYNSVFYVIITDCVITCGTQIEDDIRNHKSFVNSTTYFLYITPLSLYYYQTMESVLYFMTIMNCTSDH